MVGPLAAIIAGGGAGAAAGAGAILIGLVLAPLIHANQFLGSFWFGNGMLLGEREMYQQDWIIIKKRLDKGEDYTTILEEYTRTRTQQIMQSAQTILNIEADMWNNIVVDYITKLPKNLIDVLTGADANLPVDPVTGQVKYCDAFPGSPECKDEDKSTFDDTKTFEDTKTKKKKEISDQEKTKKINELNKKLQSWRQVIGKGVTRQQLQAAVARYNVAIANLQGQIRAESNPSKKAKIQAQLDLYLNLKKQYSAALAYVNGLGKSGATT